MPRNVLLMLGEGARMVPSDRDAIDPFTMLVTDVPDDVTTEMVADKMSSIGWLPTNGPWTVSWHRAAGASPGAYILVERLESGIEQVPPRKVENGNGSH